jgi:hypothetical protein
MESKLKTWFFLFFISISSYACSQEIGVIYDKAEAAQKFGTVVDSVQLTSSELDSLMLQSGSYIMFKIVNGNLYILGEKRNPLYPRDSSFSAEVIFRILSVSKLKELLNKGQNKKTNIEERQNAFTISNGNYLLEQSGTCPPYCP